MRSALQLQPNAPRKNPGIPHPAKRAPRALLQVRNRQPSPQHPHWPYQIAGPAPASYRQAPAHQERGEGLQAGTWLRRDQKALSPYVQGADHRAAAGLQHWPVSSPRHGFTEARRSGCRCAPHGPQRPSTERQPVSGSRCDRERTSHFSAILEKNIRQIACPCVSEH